MAKWHVIRGGKEHGPFEDAQLKKLAATGKLKRDDLVRQTDATTACTAESIKGLFPSEKTSQEIDIDGAESAEKPVEPSLSQSSLVDRARKSAGTVAAFAKLQARLKNLEILELPSAYAELGSRLIESGIDSDAIKHLINEVHELDSKIAALRADDPTSSYSTMADRAKSVGKAAMKSAQTEGLLLRRKRSITKIGEHTMAAPDLRSHPDFAKEVVKLERLREEIAQLKDESQKLSHSSSILKKTRKYAFVAGGIGILVIGCWTGSSILLPNNKQSVGYTDNPVNAVLASLDADREKARKEAEEIRKQLENTQITNEKRRELTEAQRELEIEQARLEAEKERSEVKARRGAEEFRRRKELAVQTEQEQKDRREFADRLFGGITFNPSKGISLSKRLQQDGATLELRGKEHESLRRLHESKDWLGLINKLAEGNLGQYGELPSAAVMTQVFQRGFHHTELFALIRTKANYGNRYGYTALRAISFPFSGDRSLMFDRGIIIRRSPHEFERHPDGIGYLVKWKPSDGHTIFFVSNGDDDDNYLNQVRYRFGQIESELRKKLELGEVDEKTVETRLLREMDRSFDEVKSWALQR